MKEFGKQAYADTVYINFDSNSRMADLFSADLDTDRLIMGLELYAGHKINPENTLLIFDEVQEVPRALASLKYFYENAPQYHIVCAGSLLGIALHQGTSFPVGKVDFLKLYPLSFGEFLMATGNERFAELLKKQDYEMITSFKQTYIDALKHYYFVGGMPEAVQSFAESKDFNEVRAIQKRILAAVFAVGEQLITRRLLLCDKVANGGVFGFLQCFVSSFAGFIIGANLLQIIRAQKAADIIVTIRKFDIFHVNHLLFEFVLTVYRQIFAL